MTTSNDGSYSIPIRFQISNQSIWGTSSDSSSKDTGDALCLDWDLEGHHKDKIKNVWPFGKFGSKSSIDTSGEMGFKIGASVTGGAFSVDCPATVDVSYPTNAAPGAVVALTSRMTLNANATMRTTAPNGMLTLYFHSEGSFSSSAKVKAFGEDLLNQKIADMKLDAGTNAEAPDPPPPDANDYEIYQLDLASIAEKAGDYDSAPILGVATLSLHYPSLSTAGGLDSSKTKLRSSRADMILLMSLDLTEIITRILNIPPLREKLTNHSPKGFVPSYKVEFDYSILDVFVDADAGLALDFTFEPKATISYAVQDASGNHPALYADAACTQPLAGSAAVGATVYFKMPSSDAITATPTVHYAGTLTNKPGIKVVGGVNLDVLELGVGGGVGGVSLPGFSWKPLPTQRAEISHTFPIATCQFDPHGLPPDVTGPAFSVVPTASTAKSTSSSSMMLPGIGDLAPSTAMPSGGPICSNNAHTEALLVSVRCDMDCAWSCCQYKFYWDVEDGAHVLGAQATSDAAVLQIKLDPKLLVAGEHKIICVCTSGSTTRRTVMDFDVEHWAPVISGLFNGSTALESLPAGSPTTTLTINGAGFGADSRIFIGTTPIDLHAGTTIQPNQVAVDVPAALLAVPGNYPLSVVNPAPGGGTSAPFKLTVASARPSISTITPNNAAKAMFVDGPDTPLTLVGTGFVPGSVVYVGGAPIETSFLSPTSLGAVVPSALLDHGRFNGSSRPALSVTVTTPTVVSASGHATGGASTAVSAPLQIARPYVGSFSPSALTVGAPVTMTSGAGPVLQIEGANLLPGVAVTATTSSGKEYPCKVEPSNHGTHATLYLPIDALQAPDQLTVRITNNFGGLHSSSETSYQVLKERFAGALDGKLYAVDGDGNLRWYRDDARDGTTCWSPSSGNVIAEGWGDYLLVVPADEGMLYAVTPDGDLLWFQDLAQNGTSSWAAGSGNVIARGWNVYARVVYGGNGTLYGITKDGALVWNQDQALNGTAKWAPGSGATIATGWNRFLKVASGGNCTLYCVDQGGNLFFYRDASHDGTTNWASGSGAVVSAGGWTRFTHVISGGHGMLYAAQNDGGLRWYEDLACNGTPSWAKSSGAVIATGWVNRGDDTEVDEG